MHARGNRRQRARLRGGSARSSRSNPTASSWGYWDDIIQTDTGKVFQDGYLEMTDKPGLGIELNDDVCRAHLAEGSGYFE